MEEMGVGRLYCAIPPSGGSLPVSFEKSVFIGNSKFFTWGQTLTISFGEGHLGWCNG